MAGLRKAGANGQGGASTLARARSAADKERVREAFVTAGRKLFSRGDPSCVSLRAIAAEAGYSPAAIYSYFSDQHELFTRIREQEIDRAVMVLQREIEGVMQPRERLLTLLTATAEHWVERMDDFLLIFPRHSASMPTEPPDANAVAFAETPVMRRMLTLYEGAVVDYFATLPQAPMDPLLATDMLIAAVHGTLMIPCMARTKKWNCSRTMVRHLVAAVIDSWDCQPGQAVSRTVSGRARSRSPAR